MSLKRPLHTGILAILVFDILGSISSKVFDFDYSYLASISTLIYCTISFFTARQESLRKAVLCTTLMGIFDSTVGWLVTLLIDPNTGTTDIQPYSFIMVVVMVFSMAAAGAIMGFIGGGIAMISRKNNTCFF